MADEIIPRHMMDNKDIVKFLGTLYIISEIPILITCTHADIT